MPNKLTRRDFLRVGTMAAAATVVSGCTVNLQRTEHLESYVQPPEEGLPGENLWYASTCRQCAAGCGTIVRVSDGRARKIEGNPSHPLNQGKLCARGQAALQELYDPDRLRNAVQQVGGRGSQQFEPLYWEKALASVEDRLRAADAEGVAFLGGNVSSHLWVVASRFLEALGAPPPVIYTLGDELEGRQALTHMSQQLFNVPSVPVFDVANADVVFSFGANFLETWMSPVYYSRAYGRMRRGQFGKRGYLVQFEPRLSSTAASADKWVPVRPGTEGLIALALGKIIVEEGLGNGRNKSLYEQIEISDVAEASGVPTEELEHLARIFADVDKAVAIPGGPLAAHSNAATALTAVHALNHAVGRQSNGVFLPPETGVAEFMPPPISSFANVQTLVENMASGQIKLLFVHSADPLFELPLATDFEQALRGVPLVVSFSPTVNETATQADLILPDHTNLEGWGYHVPAVADRQVVSGQQPVMRPLYDTRATVDVLLALAQRLGGDLAQALPWRNEVEFLEDITGAWRDEGTSAEAFWAGWRRQGGWWSEREEKQFLPVNPTFDAPLSLTIPTEHGESEWFNLHIYPSISLFDGRGANKSWLQETPDPMTTVSWQTWIEINPHAAERLGVQDEDVVRVISSEGEIEATVYVYPGIREDVVAMPIGQGHQQYGRYAKGHGSNPMRLLTVTTDDETGALAWAETRVWIVPTGECRSLARLEDPEGMAYLSGEGH
ncbi:MAG: molybdopterin-dependent oxidoreductase [Chloroflexi bacterium]|nr:molybdopterin-dependent oxidoreductase [Chloroflexota bacterium]